MEGTSDATAEPVNAVRIGPGQFLVEAERVASGFAFTVDGRVFAVVSDPVIVATSTYLATVREASGPAPAES